jgi:ankyrin repeat protein
MLQQIKDVTVIDAAEAGTSEDLRKLVDAGGDVNRVSNDRRLLSPLQAAGRRDDLEMAEFLIDRGADLDYRGTWGRPVLFIASTSIYSARMTQLLLRRGADPNSTDSDGRTPLYSVAESYWPDVMEALIQGGADPNFRAPDDSTPLHAAAGGNTDPEGRAIRVLVKHGAKLDSQDRRGFTPLHSAMDQTRASAAMTLLDLGADPAIRDNEGRTPAQLVRESVRLYPGIPEVIRRLSQTLQ